MEFTDTQAKEIIRELGRFTVASYKSHDMTVIDTDSGEFIIGTDNEADWAWEQELDYYLEEIIYPELPENMASYFDDEAWKRDARFDGRGHALSSYDGNELEIADLVAFRIN